MKTSSIYLLSLSLLLTATLATGCRKGLAEGENGASANGMTQINFQSGALTIAQTGNNGWASSVPHSKATPETGPEVTTPDRLPVGTTFRLVVYNAGDDPKTAEPVAQNTYKVADAEGKVLATLVDEFGTALEGTDTSAILLRRGEYDFYYFSPALPLGRNAVATYSDLGQDVDYMALYQRQSVDPSKGRLHGVTEVNFYRMASYIDIRIAPREGEIMGTLEVDPNYGLELFGFPNSAYYEIGGYPYHLTTEGAGGIVNYSAADFGAVPDLTATISTEEANGGHIVLPGVATDLRVSGVVISDGATKRFSTSLGTQIFEPGYRYLIELGISRVADDPTVEITVLPWNEVNWDNTDIGGFYTPVKTSLVSPDPTAIAYTGAEFSVTLTGVWDGTIPVRVIAEGEETAMAATQATSGTPVTLTVPESIYPTPEQTILFQYQWNNRWVDIKRGTQAQGNIYFGGTIEISTEENNTLMTWDDANTYCENKGEGWRMPTQNELYYIYCCIPIIAGTDATFLKESYWSATPYSTGRYTTFNFSNGVEVNNGTATENYVRCVRKKETSGKTYPYIMASSDAKQQGIVVLRDEEGGVDEAALFPDRETASPTGDEQSTDNRMSRKFRIGRHWAGMQSIEVARTACDTTTMEGFSDWRLPTQRELMMIEACWGYRATSGNLFDRPTGPTIVEPTLTLFYLYSHNVIYNLPEANGMYPWMSATQDSENSGQVWGVHLMPMGGPVYKSSYPLTQAMIFCVRDEW